jgi:glucokinase
LVRPGTAVGVDLGGSNVRAAVIDQNGKILSVFRANLGQNNLPETVVTVVTDAINRVLHAASLSIDQPLGVGIGIAAQLSDNRGTVAVSPNLGWRNVAFGDLMSAALGRQVSVVNDVDAIAWGEVTHGAAVGHLDVLTVFVGTGVGGGLVLNGRLYGGSSGVPAEIGHVKVRLPGAECGCGGQGCLEAYLGGVNLSRRLRKAAQTDWPALHQKIAGDLDQIHPGLVEELLMEADPRAGDLFEELSEMFGLVLANAVTLLNPAALVLGGTVLQGCPTLLELSKEVLHNRSLDAANKALKIYSAKLGNDAGIIGAGSLVMASGRNVE